MCDTLVATPVSTSTRSMLFGKNSDRQRNEAQLVELIPRAEHGVGEQVRCTYLTIPQARSTHAVLLCRPFWAWGAEMGANEHGVVIGNEAVHARSAPSEQEGLPGMDLVRLGLERAASAAEALDIIAEQLRQHGQGGNCGHLQPSYYNNGFLIADSREAWVLETVDREWFAERVTDVRAISNIYSVGKRASRVSDGLAALIQRAGWSAEDKPDYAEVIRNPDREHIGYAGARRARSTQLLEQKRGQLAVADMMVNLRDHGPCASTWRPEDEESITICMHAGVESRVGQTVGAMVSDIRENGAVHWVTATSAPCVSIFKPVLIDVPLPTRGPELTDQFDRETVWWRHELLHRRAVLGEFPRVLGSLRAERDALEGAFRARVEAVLDGGSTADRTRVVAECWREAFDLERRWVHQFAEIPTGEERPYRAAWFDMNRRARLDIA